MVDAAPTNVRYRVVGICSLMGVLLYLDRFCVSFAEVFIKEELGLSATDISLMFGVFFASYALGQTPSGWLADRFGGRLMLTLFIVSWSVFTALLGFANGVTMLVLLRFGMGFAQAGAFPTAASMLSKWVPLAKRGIASSLVALGGRIGGALSLFITPFVILYFVPTTVDSKLTERDLLRADRLAYELSFGSRPVSAETGDGGTQALIGARILENLPSETRADVGNAAGRFREQTLAAEKSDTKQFPDATSIEFRKALSAGLNSIVSSPDFFTAKELEEVKIEHEAKRLMANAPASRTESETQRMNRLVLEAIYPLSIRKVYGAGWRQMTFLYGMMGLPMAFLFWRICRDEPRQHPRCNAAELELIEAHRPPSDSAAKVSHLPLFELATNVSMWFNGAMQFFTNVGWIFLMTYLPRYLIEIHQVPVASRAWMSTVPTIVAIIGMFCGGFMADRMVDRFGRRWGRSLPIAITRFAAGGAYLLCLFDPSPWTAVALLSVAAFFCDLGIPAVWAFQQDVGGKHTGSVLGWGNMWGNFGAALGPYLIGWCAGDNQNWDAVFLTCAAAFGISGLVSLGVNATRKVVPD